MPPPPRIWPRATWCRARWRPRSRKAAAAARRRDHVLLKLDHLGAEVIDKRLPGIREIAKKFANVDPVKDPIPVVPTCHYMMGGMPTNYHGQVVARCGTATEAWCTGLYAAGECRLRLGARRQSPGHQFAARPAGLRQGRRRSASARSSATTRPTRSCRRTRPSSRGRGWRGWRPPLRANACMT